MAERFTEFQPDEIEGIYNEFRAKMLADIFAVFGARPQPRRALAYRGGQFVSLPIDDNGNVIEPPPRCPKCGPFLLCHEHMPF